MQCICMYVYIYCANPLFVSFCFRLPATALAALEEELVSVLELLLKSLSLPYSSDLGLAALSAPLLLLISHRAGEAAAGTDTRRVSRYAACIHMHLYMYLYLSICRYTTVHIFC